MDISDRYIVTFQTNSVVKQGFPRINCRMFLVKICFASSMSFNGNMGRKAFTSTSLRMMNRDSVSCSANGRNINLSVSK